MENITKGIIFTISLIIVTAATAGGDPDFVAYPEGYQDSFTFYGTANRANGKQVADFYANPQAIASIGQEGPFTDGSRIVMEVYKKKKDAEGNPIMGEDGIYVKGPLAAVGVMEKRSDWTETFPADQRAGDWGFALYDPAGKPKNNDLECATCHTSNAETNYMFSRGLMD